jgi:hypothetical protein
MPDPTTIKFGEVPFTEAIRILREMVPMTDDQYRALEAIAQQKAFSFAGAYSESMATAVQNVLADVASGKVSIDQLLEKANAALDAFGESLTPFQAHTIFETSLSRVFNDGALRRYHSTPGAPAAYPYFGIDTAFDSRVRPNHYALDWRRIKTVFPVTDMLLTQWPLPAGYRCRCARRFFSESQVTSLGLQVGSGEDWYGRTEAVAVPGGLAHVVQILPDPGFGPGSLTAKSNNPPLLFPSSGGDRGVGADKLIRIAAIIVTLNAAQRRTAA